MVFPPAALRASPLSLTYQVSCVLAYSETSATHLGSGVRCNNLNLLQARPSSLTGNVQRLEDSLLRGPSTGKGRGGVRSRLTVLDLLRGEVSLPEGLRRWDARDELSVNPDTSDVAGLGEQRLQCSSVCGLQGDSRGELASEGERVLAWSSPSQRVKEYLLLHVADVRRRILDLDKVVGDHGGGETSVRAELTCASSLGVRIKLVRLQRGVQVSRVDDRDLSSNLTETERGQETGLETDMLDRFGGVEEVRERLELGGDVVGVVVTGHDSSREGLEHTVELPSSSTTLRVTSERLLSDDRDRVTLRSSELLELLVVDVRFVLVVRLGRGTVARDNADRVGVKTPDGESSSEGSDVGVLALEHTEGGQSLLLLSLGLLLNEADSVLEPLVSVGTLVSLELSTEKLVLVLEPLGDLSSSESELTSSVLDVKQKGRLLERDLSGAGKDTLARSRDGSTGLVHVSRGETNDTSDGSTKLDGSLGAHQDVDTATHSLHETSTGAGHGSRELSGLTSHGELRLGIAGSLHVGEFEGSLLGEIVETTGNHDLRLARLDRVARDFNRLKSGGTDVSAIRTMQVHGMIYSPGSDGDLDRTGSGHEKQVDPTSDSVDETTISGSLAYDVELTSPGEYPFGHPSPLFGP